jgi:two-component system nitrogen regulation response regulator NtrX
MSKKEATILIVDDDVSICKTLGLILEENGYVVQTAHTGKDAIKKSKASVFNVAILDVKLPDVEGTELLKALPETTPKMIKIMFTGYPELENAVKALNEGADAYIMKPADPDKILKTIEEKLEQQANAEKITEDKISTFLETRVQKLLSKL